MMIWIDLVPIFVNRFRMSILDLICRFINYCIYFHVNNV